MFKFLKKKRVLVLLFAVAMGLIACHGFVLADDTSITIDNPLGTLTFTDIIGKLIDFLLAIALIICPLMIVVGGFYFITAAGNPEKANQGRQIMVYAMIGLVIILVSKGLVTAVQTAIGVK